MFFFLNFNLPLPPPKFRLFTKMPSFFFSFENVYFTLSPSTSSSIHNIATSINNQPPWTTNLKLLMHLKINLHSFFLDSYELKTTSLYFLSIFIQKTKILILKFLWFIEPLKLMILGGSLLFEILGAWRRILCAKQVISLVETLKLIFFSRSVRPDDFLVSHLVVDDLHGSLVVNAEVSFAIDF